MQTTTVVALLLPLALAAPSRRPSPAPLIKPRGAQLVDGKYIIKLKHDVKDGALSNVMSALSSTADHVYNSGMFSGFAAALTAGELEVLRDNDNVRLAACLLPDVRMSL